MDKISSYLKNEGHKGLARDTERVFQVWSQGFYKGSWLFPPKHQQLLSVLPSASQYFCDLLFLLYKPRQVQQIKIPPKLCLQPPNKFLWQWSKPEKAKSKKYKTGLFEQNNPKENSSIPEIEVTAVSHLNQGDYIGYRWGLITISLPRARFMSSYDQKLSSLDKDLGSWQLHGRKLL